MAANASGNPQQQNLYETHLANLNKPYNPTPAQFGIQNNYLPGTNTGTTTTGSGVQAPNPYGLTTEQIYWALAGTPDSIRRLGESLGGYGENVDPAKKQLFHTVVNYYASGGGAFDSGYTPEDAAKAQASYMAGSGTGYQPQQWLAGMPVYGSMADAAAGNVAGYATGTGMNYSATPGGGGGGGGAPGTGTTPGTGTGTTTPGAGTGTTTPGAGNGAGGGSTQYGDRGDTGDFPMASAATWTQPTYDKYAAPTRPESTTTPWDFFNDEGYQFRLKEGTDAIQNTAAARGGLQSGNTLKSLSKYASGLASDEYGQAYGRYDNSRRFAEGQFQADRGFGRDVFTGDRAFDFTNATDARNYNNQNRMWDTSFNNSNRIDARNFDYGVYTGDRDFNEGQRRWDLGFNYNAANADRDFESGNSRFLATLGANANNNYASAMTQLATLLSQLEMKGAGAGATGDIGAGNTLSATLQQILASLGNYAKVNNPTTP